MAQTNAHSDLKEYGFNGKVKRVTTFNYTEFKIANGEWQPLNDSSWSSKTVFDFNSIGNFVQTITIAKPQGSITSLTTLITKHTYSNGNHFAKEYDINGMLLTTIKYEWVNNVSYKIFASNIYGKIDFTSKIQLNKNFRDQSGEFMLYAGKDTLNYGYKYKNSIDTNNKFTKVIRTYAKTNMVEETYFVYQKLDANKNPQKIILSHFKMALLLESHLEFLNIINSFLT